MPSGAGPFPAVILVHGSGPNDRDETIGPNKPFKDLAWAVASRGVAVLRYEKRTKQHSAKLASVRAFTVKEEVLDDAMAAFVLLRTTEGIVPNASFVLGHSLGGMLVPHIGRLDPNLRRHIQLFTIPVRLKTTFCSIRMYAPAQYVPQCDQETIAATEADDTGLSRSVTSSPYTDLHAVSIAGGTPEQNERCI